ncbi:hypothetical protein [Macrococcoides canis]|uniref:hypothetical protein n=1 Tax=Macrococcoides canis TaxID=1855823 RepID=UPI0010FC2BB2|nr:hypothetical protein [Macrococcus canis]MCO4096891.1 hypothetical protein [Macrococcus canis]QCT75428.1 hypothetical protein EST43_09345 [Macrococcus canis]UTH02027.1 hypothetical protein KFV05_10105 [Macrococcus canis]
MSNTFEEIDEYNNWARQQPRVHSGDNKCSNCKKNFTVIITNDGYPNRTFEEANCPYCQQTHVIRTSGIVYVK